MDPTQPLRDKIGNFFSNLVPENSPLAKSNANVLTNEAMAEIDKKKAMREPAQEAVVTTTTDENFVTPAQQATTQQVQPQELIDVSVPKNLSEGIKGEGQAQAAQAEADSKTIGKIQEVQDKAAQENAEKQKRFQEDSQKYQDQITAVSKEMADFKLKPKDIWENKNAFQKILGGISMVLGSITPEGAKNITNMIDNEINRDISLQKAAYEQLGDKRANANNAYKMFMDKFQSDEIAQKGARDLKLEALKAELLQNEARAKSQIAKSNIQKSIGLIELEQNKLRANLQADYAKLLGQQKNFQIPGLQGTAKTDSAYKETLDRISAKDAALAKIDQMEKLLEQGAKTPMSINSEKAEVLRSSLAADLAKAAFGRSSDAELELKMKEIPKVNSFLTRPSVAKALFKTLRKSVTNDAMTYAKGAGYSLQQVSGAKNK